MFARNDKGNDTSSACRTGCILASFLQYTAILLPNPIIRIGLASKSFFLQIFEITNFKIINKSSTESK